MSNTETLYTARFEMPELIERGRQQVLQCRAYRDGALATPSSGTVSLYDDDGTAIVNGAAVTVVGAVAQYTLSAATTSSLSLEEGWRIEWALVMPDGVTHTFRNDAALVRRRLYPVITDADLFRRVSALDPSGATTITAKSDYQDYIDEAWNTIQRRLLSSGNRPNLAMNPSAFRDVHLSLTLAYIFGDLATRINDAYEAREMVYRKEYEDLWRSLRLIYDEDDDGIAETQSRRNATPTVWLNSGGRW